MDYKRIEDLVEEYRRILDMIDELALMWHFNIRRLKSDKESGDRRTYHISLADMQAPLCLANRIEYLEKEGYSILPASYEERGKDVILKGKTPDDKHYKLVLEREADFGKFIVTYTEGEETGRYPIFEYKPELFAEDKVMIRELINGLSGLLRR